MFLLIVYMIFSCFCINAQGEFPSELHSKIAAFLMKCDINDIAVTHFYNTGLSRQTYSGHSAWSANTAWSVLGFCQTRPIKSHYVTLSLLETMSLTQEQRRVLKTVFQTKDESYDYYDHYGTDRDMFTSIDIARHDFAILNSCSIETIKLFCGKPTDDNTHIWYGVPENFSLPKPEHQYILVNVYEKVYIQKANPNACTYIHVEGLRDGILYAKPFQCLQSIKNIILSYLSTKELSYCKSIQLILMFETNDKFAFKNFSIEYPDSRMPLQGELRKGENYFETDDSQ